MEVLSDDMVKVTPPMGAAWARVMVSVALALGAMARVEVTVATPESSRFFASGA